MHTVVDASLLAGALIDSEGSIGRAMSATADGRLANAPTVSVPVELFVPDGTS